jgi:hypothetical protein
VPPALPVILAASPARPGADVSFFDDEPDEPTRVTRPARPRRSSAGSAATHAPDPDIARRRQLALFAGLAVFAILVIFLFNSCSKTRHKNALKDYNRNVSSIVQSSDSQVSKPLFEVLSGGGQTQDVQVAVNQVRLVADEDVKRAKALDPPGDDETKAAQHDLELTLNFRATGVRKIADLLPRALSNQGSAVEAINKIAGQMQGFLASDVVYSQRVAPLIQQALDKNDIHGQSIASSKFLPSIGWLDPGQVGDKLNPDAGVSQGRKPGQPKPGRHGHALISVKVGNVTLQPGGATNRVPATAPLPVDVTYANQGENDETNVNITVRITGGPKTITQRKRLNLTKAGTQGTVTVQVPQVPPKGTSTTLQVTIEKVLGEQTLDNNTQKYTVLFT